MGGWRVSRAAAYCALAVIFVSATVTVALVEPSEQGKADAKARRDAGSGNAVTANANSAEPAAEGNAAGPVANNVATNASLSVGNAQ
jgi:hypothetical protein